MPDTGSSAHSDASQPLLRPAEVAERLNISAATLRRWSSRFSEFLELSESSQDGGSHRRYTPGDVATLGRVQELLEQGWTYEQVADRLARDPQEDASEAAPDQPVKGSSAVVEPERLAETAMVTVNEIFDSEDLPPAARFLRDTMQTVTSTQQVILNSQQASRELLGVMIQDNLNLKGENATLRERMLELERELAELHRHFADTRERTEVRMRVLEDAIAKLMAAQQSPATRSGQPAGSRPTPAPSPQAPQTAPAPNTGQPTYPPPTYAPASYPASGYAPQPSASYPPPGYTSPPASYPPPYADQQAPPPKRGFWARLLGG